MGGCCWAVVGLRGAVPGWQLGCNWVPPQGFYRIIFRIGEDSRGASRHQPRPRRGAAARRRDHAPHIMRFHLEHPHSFFVRRAWIQGETIPGRSRLTGHAPLGIEGKRSPRKRRSRAPEDLRGGVSEGNIGGGKWSPAFEKGEQICCCSLQPCTMRMY